MAGAELNQGPLWMQSSLRSFLLQAPRGKVSQLREHPLCPLLSHSQSWCHRHAQASPCQEAPGTGAKPDLFWLLPSLPPSFILAGMDWLFLHWLEWEVGGEEIAPD